MHPFLIRARLIINHIFGSSREFTISLDNLLNSIQKVLLTDELSSSSNSEHTSLGTNTSDISSSSIRAKPSKKFKSNVLLHAHGSGVNLEDMSSSFQIRQTKFNLSVNSSRSCQGRIKGIRSVSCHQHLDVSSSFETIKLIDNFKHSSLDFII